MAIGTGDSVVERIHRLRFQQRLRRGRQGRTRGPHLQIPADLHWSTRETRRRRRNMRESVRPWKRNAR
jgi:hypothetical protein